MGVSNADLNSPSDEADKSASCCGHEGELAGQPEHAGTTLLFEVVLVPVEAEQVVVRAFDLDPADFAALVDVGRLAGGDVAIVLAFTEPTPSGHLAEIDNDLRERGANGAGAPDEWDRTPESAPRTLTFEDDSGVLVLHDLALGPL